LTYLFLLSEYLLIIELCLLYSNLGVTKIMMQAISNVHAGHIWPAGLRFPNPSLQFRV